MYYCFSETFYNLFFLFQYFVKYGPTYELHIDPSLQKDLNTNDYIDSVVNEIALNCSFIV